MSEQIARSSEASLISHDNNFDLIRLVAAFQVALSHGASHLNYPLPAFFDFIQFIPGVPIFFTVSGFLIGNSYCRKPNAGRYFINRSLRIFPGLWACFLVTTSLLLLFNILNFESLRDIDLWKWVICQVTIFQFYTPDMLRGWGTGTPNGSLWTIPIEIQFYILLPILVSLIARNKILRIVTIIGILLVSLFCNFYYSIINQETLFAKLFHVSILPFLMYFMFGLFLFLLWSKIKLLIIDKALIWLGIYIVYIVLFSYFTNSYQLTYYPNLIGWISYLILSVLTLSLAFSYRSAAKKLLRGNDISYGIYIYHMVVINSILELKITQHSLLIAILCTIILAFMSWKLVEKPFLGMKHKLIRNTNHQIEYVSNHSGLK